jgi:hypothetical protein
MQSYHVYFQNFEEYDFGEQTVDAIHLSLRYSTSDTNGYYQPTACVSFTWTMKKIAKRVRTEYM